jgi:hypothetical protein
MFLLLIAAHLFSGHRRELLTPAVAFAAIVLPVWMLTRTSDPLRGLSAPLAQGSRAYAWDPNPSAPPDVSADRREIQENWKTMFRDEDPDRARERMWRLGHGLLGSDFYDARWNAGYASMTRISRLGTPVLILSAVAVLIAARRKNLGRVLGLLLVLLAIAQSFVLGALARYGLPFLPPILLYAASAFSQQWTFRRAALGSATFLVLLAVTATHRYVLDQEWGVLEAAGTRLKQRIARGALPRSAPATLHLRIGRPVQPSAAGLEIYGPGGRMLYTSLADSGDGPYITIDLPQWFLDENHARAVDLELATSGFYGPNHFWLYPVIPPLWAPSACRDDSAVLSPASGIDRGSLDWWAHAGPR